MAFEVLILTVSVNFVACSTGRSPGFAPLRMLSTGLPAGVVDLKRSGGRRLLLSFGREGQVASTNNAIIFAAFNSIPTFRG